MPCSGIEQRVRALSPAKRALLVKRLRESPGPGVAAGHVNGARLTAFLTAEPSALDRLEVESDELRAYLSRLLPEYMIPASFRVLDSMPLLPNGKVDVAALGELPGEVDSTAESWVEPRNATEQLLADIWCDVLQMDSVSVHDNFFELGGDSILSIHVVSKVNQQGFSLSPNDLFNFPTIAQLDERIRTAAGEGRQANPPTDVDEVTPLLRESADQSNGKGSFPVIADDARQPLIIVHAVSEMVSVLRSHLDLDRPVYALTATVHWEQGDLERNATVERLAEENLVELRSLQPVGPYFLGGYSMGAPIAFEMAYRLQLAGETVELLFLLDPPGRAVSSSRPGPPFFSSRNVARHLARISGRSIVEKLRYLVVKTNRAAKHHILNRLRVLIRKRLVRPGATVMAMLYRRCGLQVPTPLINHYVGSVYADAWGRYQFKPYDGSVAIFLASNAPQDRQLWEGITKGELTIEWFEGKHHDFVRNPALMRGWTSSLAQLLTGEQTKACAGNSDGTTR